MSGPITSLVLTPELCMAPGFRGAGVAAGLKANGNPDVALIVSQNPCDAVGVFTTNVVKSASIQISQKHLALGAKMRGVILTSGNANAATGVAGREAVVELCGAAAGELGGKPEEFLVAQTGLIGKPFDRKAGNAGVIAAAKLLAFDGGLSVARAIQTTDTRPKGWREQIKIAGSTVNVCGVAKGAAMLAPSMATMLAVVTTDANVSAPLLQEALKAALDDSFHSMVVDGCRSTNDTVFLLANRYSGTHLIRERGEDYNKFAEAVRKVCVSLAQQMAGDAEGATKLFTVKVRGARSKADARMAAKGVVSSALVKCSLAGEVCYFGRVLSELGASGANFDPEKVQICYGPHCVCRNGVVAEADEEALSSYMKNRELVIEADLGGGNFSAEAYGCDLTHGYVDENMGKS